MHACVCMCMRECMYMCVDGWVMDGWIGGWVDDGWVTGGWMGDRWMTNGLMGGFRISLTWLKHRH